MAAIEDLRAKLDPARLPKHVAIIMDGNGRWAEAHGQPRIAGHREGSQSVRAITRLARRIGVKALTVYAFSSENWKRPVEEVAALMDLLREYLLSERSEIMDNGIRLNALGNLDRLPHFVREPLDALMADSRGNREMVLSLALSYGGREEILSACRALLRDGVDPDALDEKTFAARLSTFDLPDPDLIIRTSGEQRISNFLLWQAAYSELLFTPVAWPDFREEAFLTALVEYQGRERRFGLTGAQAKTAPK
ncbi:MAG TPA: isoprenyl transferase [Myxococcales bacterium]